jgi:hypothetical protein
MRFLKRLAIGLVLLAATFAVVVAFQPDDYRLTRSTVIWAPAAKIFPARQRSASMGGVVALGEARPERQVTFSGPQSGPALHSNGTATTRSAPAR